MEHFWKEEKYITESPLICLENNLSSNSETQISDRLGYFIRWEWHWIPIICFSCCSEHKTQQWRFFLTGYGVILCIMGTLTRVNEVRTSRQGEFRGKGPSESKAEAVNSILPALKGGLNI